MSHGAKTSPSSKPNRKVLIDANVWFSAIVYGGTPESTVLCCFEAQDPILVSEPLVDELIGQLKLKVKAPHRWLRELRIQLEDTCELLELGNLPDVVRDPKDNHLIAAAVTGGCNYLVTGDKDLLTLAEHFDFAILTPTEFLRLL